MLQTGLFIVFEGAEGSSKSTQSLLLCDWLSHNKIPYIRVREPDGPIRDLVLDPAHEGQISDSAEVLLYAASRVNNYEKIIKPALAEGKVVVCDRFLESSLAYQGYAGGIPPEVIQNIHDSFLTNDRITLFLDVSIETSLLRIGLRNNALDRMEKKDISYHEKVIYGYKKLASEHPYIYTINAERDKEIIHAEILSTLHVHLVKGGYL